MIQTDMKRALATNEEVRPEKRMRTDNYEIRLLLPSGMMGTIIGKGGDKIQKMRNNHYANIRLSDSEGPERMMTIQGKTYENIVAVVAETLSMLSEDNALDMQEIRVMIHKSMVGAIIGKEGSIITKLRESSGASVIRAFGDCAPLSTDRCLLIRGTNEAILSALKEVTAIMETTDTKGIDRPYDPNNFNEFSAGQYGGYAKDGNFLGAISRGRNDNKSGIFGMPSSICNPPPRNPGMEFLLRWKQDLIQARMNILDGRIQDVQYSSHAALSTGLDAETTQTVEMPIPNEYIGSIIGKRGSKITEIRYDSNSKINIRDSEKEGERTISITGTKASIQIAKAMIQQRIVIQKQGIDTKGRIRSESHSITTGTEDADGIETVEMSIPNEKVSALIGPKGTRITKIREESMTKISIQNSGASGQRHISVTGSKKNIEKAQEMIKLFTI